MALTFSSQGKGTARVDHAVKGMVFKHVNMLTSTGAGGADYSSGFTIRGNASKFGLRTVFFVVPVSIQNGAGTTVTNLVLEWDEVAGKLRAFIMNTAVEESGTNITANSNIQFLAVGV